MKAEIKAFLIIYLECFLIFVFLGELLPRFIELLLNNYYGNPEFHRNSILVGGETKGTLQLVYNYMRIFKLFLF